MGNIKTDSKFINGNHTQDIYEMVLSNEEYKNSKQNSVWTDAVNSESSALQDVYIASEKKVNDKKTVKHSIKIPKDITPNDIYLATMYNDIQYANKKGVELHGKYYDFNEYGDCERIYIDKPAENINGNKNSYMRILYDKTGEVSKIYQYENNGITDVNGTKTCGIYDKKGKLTSFYVESEFNQISGDAGKRSYYNNLGKLKYFYKYKFGKNGKKFECKDFDANGTVQLVRNYDKDGKAVITYNPNNDLDNFIVKLHANLHSLTEKSFVKLIKDIEDIDLDDSENLIANPDTDKFFYVMQRYAECTEHYLLDDIAKKNKKLADFIIKRVVRSETKNDKESYKYTENILADMAEHPEDYGKLSVDIQRLMNRPWIEKSEELDDKKLILDNEINDNVKQTISGNCYLVSNIKSIDSKSIGRKALNSLRQNLPSGDVFITCKGNNKVYLITKKEILKSNHLSTGDYDMRVYELAMDKYRRDMAYEEPGLEVDDYGGALDDICRAFFGIDINTKLDISNCNFENFNSDNIIYDFSITDDKGDVSCPKVLNKNNEPVELITNHDYRILRTSSDRIYFSNPWNNSDELSMSIDEFNKLPNLECSKFDLNLIKI